MSFKRWLNVVTIALIVLVVVLARHDIVDAWHLLWKVNLWIFLLIIPIQFLSYYAAGAMIFSYLKQRGDLQGLHWWENPKMALELNFVNHIFPTAGVSGASYMTFRLNKLGVSTGRATLAQVVKFAVTFLSYTALLLVAVIAVTIDSGLERMTILVACGLVTAITLAILLSIYLLGSPARLKRFEDFLDAFINGRLTKLFKRQKPYVQKEKMTEFFTDLHEDYLELKRNPRVLVRPFLWGLVFNASEVAMFFVTFLALGAFVNPAPILIALGLAGLVGSFLITPGGAGGYEAAMILFLKSAGVAASVTVAGILLARTSLVLLTIVSGYLFYNSAMKKYGTDTTPR